jgi:environmental stress-induced protein Ves
MQIVRYAALVSTPWKNGAGITREIIRQPNTGHFRWRLSLADIAQSGPFSEFTGYRRIMALLEGNGVVLRFEGGESRTLLNAGEHVEFSGGVRTHCELIDGPCVDLNLMILESLPAPAVQVLEPSALRERATLHAAADGVTVVVALAGGIVLQPTAPGHGAPGRLERWDSAVLLPGDGAVRLAAEGGGGGVVGAAAHGGARGAALGERAWVAELKGL